MKWKIILFIFLSVISTGLFAQIRKIPPAVTDAMSARYPHAKKVSWRDHLSSFQAEYILNGTEMKSYFNNKGEWVYSEKKISFNQLPEAVMEGFGKCKYTNWTSGSIEEIERQGKPLQYRIFVRKNSVEKKYLYFDSNGMLLREAITL